MDIASSAAIILLILITLWWVLRPLWQTDELSSLPGLTANREPLAELYHRRDAVYAAIKDLEFDLAANKVSQKDYKQFRTQLTTQAAEILKRVDHVSQASDDTLEAEVDALLSRFETGEGVGDEALRERVRLEIRDSLRNEQQLFCPNCQNSVSPEDIFCSRCGTSLNNQCPNCREAVLPQDRFCSHCGAALMAEAAE